MQTIILVVCTKGNSLRELIANDRKLSDHGLEVVKEKQTGRNPGWTKVRGTYAERQGTINFEWSTSTNILMCRVVNKGAGRPDLIVGDFVEYLLKRHRKRLKHITVVPR